MQVSDLVYHVSLARGAAERDVEAVGRITGLSPSNILKLKPKVRSQYQEHLSGCTVQ